MEGTAYFLGGNNFTVNNKTKTNASYPGINLIWLFMLFKDRTNGVR